MTFKICGILENLVNSVFDMDINIYTSDFLKKSWYQFKEESIHLFGDVKKIQKFGILI